MKSFKGKEIESKVLPLPDLKYLDIENIQYAPYQRELNEHKVDEIVKDFLPDIADYPLISLRRGIFWCVDGQHIIKALLKMGYTSIPCRLITGLTYEEECLRFIILNTGRTRLTANQIFHGKVEEKDACAIALVETFEKYGYKYNKNSSGRGENLIGTVINGLKTFLNEYPDAEDDILIKALEKISPRDLEDDAKDSKKVKRIQNPRAGSTCYHVAKIIAELYENETNKPKRGRKSLVV